MQSKRMYQLFTTFAATLLCTSLSWAPSLSAQPTTSSAASIMARMRTVLAEQSKHSSSAAFTVKTTVVVRESDSKFDLIKPQTVIQQSAGVYHRDPVVGARIRVNATRSTAPLSGIARGPLENFQSLGDLVEVGDDEIVILNTAFVSPLADDADQFYDFSLGSPIEASGATYDVINVVPRSSLRPLFEGTLRIIAQSNRSSSHPLNVAGSIARVELTPTATSAIPFIDSLRILQSLTFDASSAARVELSVSGSAHVRIIAFGISEPRMDFRSDASLTDVRLDAPMPDSLRLQSSRVVIQDGASSFTAWAPHHSMSPGEIETITTSRNRYDESRRNANFALGGMIDYNRAGGATPTLSAGVTFGPIAVNASGGYSFGLKRPVAEGSVAVGFGDPSSITASVRGSAFSSIATTSTGDKSYPRVMNTLVAATLHQDYYNFMRKDGWNSGVDVGYGKMRLGVTYEQSRQFSIGNNAVWSLLTMSSKEFQINPAIFDGSYNTIQAELAFSRVSPFLKLTPVGDDDFRWSLTGMSGGRTSASRATENSFNLVEALASYSIPMLRTGYNPITLTLLGAGGTASASLPPQYQFRLRTSAASFGKPGGFVSPPKGVFGGTEYIALGSELNLTDLPWRAIGLPTVNGRGIELILAGGAARYRQSHPTGFQGMDNEWYSEVGFALSRIPLFITEIVYGRVDLRKGFGPQAKFGFNFTFVTPL